MVDFLDSIKNNDYFSLEGLLGVFKQVRQSQYALAKTLTLEHLYRFLPFLYVKPLQQRIYKTPDSETPKYDILKRTANYELCLLFLEQDLLYS